MPDLALDADHPEGLGGKVGAVPEGRPVDATDEEHPPDVGPGVGRAASPAGGEVGIGPFELVDLFPQGAHGCGMTAGS